MSDSEPNQVSSGGRSRSSENRKSSTQEDSTTRFTIDLPSSLHKRIKMQSTIREERPMKALIVEAVEQYLDRNE
jgi:hypothetical protein